MKGLCQKKDGKGYEGEWKNFKYHGKGIKFYPDGSKYEGEFKDHKPIGKGKRIAVDGKEQKGEWVNMGEKLEWIAIESQELVLDKK